MASATQVRDFLAHWFQLGKPVLLPGDRGQCLPAPIFRQGQYSREFEECWQAIMATQGQDCYLSGCPQSIATLLSPAWDVTACARCSMPVYLPTLGLTDSPCPCHDLNTWPNYDVPIPRRAVQDDQHLSQIQTRLARPLDQPSGAPRGAYEAEDTRVFSDWRGIS
jgi:hypothetical protein